MKIDDNIIKRFQFDLEMGRFSCGKKPYLDEYAFYSEKNKEVEFFIEFLKVLGFEEWEDTCNGPYFGAVVNTTHKLYWYYESCEYEETDNPIPDYIKELVKNDN